MVTPVTKVTFAEKIALAASHLIRRYFQETPCPGRNLPEDTCCFDLSGVTGLGQVQTQFHPGQIFE